MRGRKVLTVALMAAAITVPAHAASMERATFRLSAIVPTVCRVAFAGTAAQPESGLVDLGNFSELCNDRHGFRITMSHGSDLNGAELIVDGRSIPLSASGQTLIVDENQPMERVQSMQLRVNGTLTELPNLSFQIEPKGPRF